MQTALKHLHAVSCTLWKNLNHSVRWLSLFFFSTTTATHIWFNPLRESQAAKASNLTTNHRANTLAGMQTQPQPTITKTASLCWFGSAMGDCSQPTRPAAGTVVYSPMVYGYTPPTPLSPQIYTNTTKHMSKEVNRRWRLRVVGWVERAQDFRPGDCCLWQVWKSESMVRCCNLPMLFVTYTTYQA